jgi:hypothetical protein
MVWARTKLLIWDYVFEPVKNINIAYSGKSPEKLYKKINELIRTIFNIPEAYIQEKSYKWDKTKDSESFDVSWELTKIYDKFTFMVVEVTLKGVTDGKEGKAVVAIKPRMITEYPQDTVWQQNLFYEIMRRFWHTIFYHRQRMEYLDTSKELCIGFESAIKSFMEELRK